MANNVRQQLYDKIRASSKDEVILEEMKRLGFWPEDQDVPHGSEEMIKRKGELQRELRELIKKQHLYQDPEEALKLMRKERMQDSKQRRAENKQRRLQQKYEKALQWFKRRQKEILYLGPGVSHGLNHAESDLERLEKQGLPQLHTAKDMSDAMGVSLSELRFLCYSRPVSRITHYQRFTISKKTGGERLISAPMPRLKRAQYWILENILNTLPLHDAAHGFRAGRSIVTNAQPHIGTHLVLNYDLKDFFPSIQYVRVKGLFRHMGYSEQLATLLALICTQPQVQAVNLDGETYYVENGMRILPQGAPSSPAVTNLLCRRLDKRLQGAAKSAGFRYSRYADDMTFSAPRSHAKHFGKLQWRLENIVKDEGFELHPDKSRAMRANNQQQVTGIVVNSKASLDRKTLKRFRAVLFQIEKDGPEGKTWGNAQNVLNAIRGYANYIAMVDPDKGKKYQMQVQRIFQKQGYRADHVPPSPFNPSRFRAAIADNRLPKEDWWQAKERPEPVLAKIETKQKPKAGTQAGQAQRSTQDIINDAGRTTRMPGMPRHGMWRRVFVRLKRVFWWILATYLLIQLFRAAPVVGAILVVVIFFFAKSLRD